MALALTTAQRNALRSGPLALYLCCDLELDSGTERFWDGPEDATIDGDTFLAIGAFASASSVSMGLDLGGGGVELMLDATKLLDAAANPTDPAYFLSTIISNGGYRQRPMHLYYSFWNASTGLHILQVRAFTGLIDQMTILQRPGADGRGQAILKVACESLTLRYGTRVGRVRSHADQQEIWPGDDFFKFCAGSVAQERNLDWGKEGSNNGGGGGLNYVGGLGGGGANPLNWRFN
ncbi:MAG: hypothetical protein NW206_19850 [Hyphomonadaceae bacterium]|nr:hypothetical protein [Hyphomonadaceae bacterium]